MTENKKAPDGEKVQRSVKHNVVDVNGKVYDSVIDVDDDFTVKSIKSSKYSKFIDRMAGQTVGVINSDGKAETVVFARQNDRVTKDGKIHPAIGEVRYIKGDMRKSVIVNISDSLRISFDNGTTSENTHGWLDKNGWVTKRCFILSNGIIYPADLRIAKSADGRNIMYTVNVNKKEGINADLSASNKEAVRTETPSADDNTTSTSKSQGKEQKSRKVAERDREYNAAVKSGDMKAAARLVEEAARAAGYDSPLLYHGTISFGFTKFDLNEMDDKRSIFLTSSNAIASTYAGTLAERQIGKNRYKTLRILMPDGSMFTFDTKKQGLQTLAWTLKTMLRGQTSTLLL